MKSKEILLINPGPDLDQLVTDLMQEIDGEIQGKAWSTDPLAMLELREFIAATGVDVHITKQSSAPASLEEYVILQNSEEDEDKTVAVASDNLPEALAKAYALHRMKSFGEFRPKWEAAMASAQRRPAKVYLFPSEN